MFNRSAPNCSDALTVFSEADGKAFEQAMDDARRVEAHG